MLWTPKRSEKQSKQKDEKQTENRWKKVEYFTAFMSYRPDENCFFRRSASCFFATVLLEYMETGQRRLWKERTKQSNEIF